jgi:hypothetical protein
MPSKSTTTSPISDDAVRTRAYLMWEADGRPWGRDEHYWKLALSELSAPAPAKLKRAAATAKPAEKKAKATPAVVKPVKAAAKVLKSAAAKVLKAPSKAKKPKA